MGCVPNKKGVWGPLAPREVSVPPPGGRLTGGVASLQSPRSPRKG